jgi:alanyl-tRNA synthetase
MNAQDLREKFIKFFEGKGHKLIPSSSLVPENDPTVLFTTAGMHPLVPYLLGEKHPAGNRLVDVQKCIRTGDIDEVGDNTHLTFFEMIGYWSLGDYWKKEAIEFTFEFFTKELGIDLKNIAVTCFAGERDIPKDTESAEIWQSLGIPIERIAFLGREDNFWGPAGEIGPCGPDTEIFVWTGDGEAPAKFEPEDKGWMEAGNDVFMGYEKVHKVESKAENGVEEFEYRELSQKNVDFGGGFERITAYLEGKSNVYETELFEPILNEIEILSGKKYSPLYSDISVSPSVIPAKAGIQESPHGSPGTTLKNTADPEDDIVAMRIIADHLKAAVFAINDGAIPSNKDRGYVIRRLIRRAIVKAHQLGISDNFTTRIAKKVFQIYEGIYFRCPNSDVISTLPDRHSREGGNLGVALQNSKSNQTPGSPGTTLKNTAGPEDDILAELEKEERKFRATLQTGLLKIEDWVTHSKDTKDVIVHGNTIFDWFQSFGLPYEVSVEQIKNLGADVSKVSKVEFEECLRMHQELSRTASAGKFKGGLAEAGEITTKYHTATHLILSALRQVLGDHVYQKGSNITAERMRFDFSHSDKMTPEQIKQVEDIVNEKIKEDLIVDLKEMSLEDAKNCGAMGVFESKYGERVKVYSIGDFSKEMCGGPHITHTGELGKFKIVKEEASSAGVRRIKAVLS